MIEKALNKYFSTGLPVDDPYWRLFNVNKQMSEAILEAIRHGFREGYKACNSIADRMEDAATIRYLRHREEILLETVEFYADTDRNIANISSDYNELYIGHDGEKDVWKLVYGKMARDALSKLKELNSYSEG